ncbi:MAG TPA: ATP-binding protein [Puia sp.]|nr:ATP-binding protein [Puia sp.]
MQDKEIVISIVIICTLLIIILIGFIAVILLLYQKKQNLFNTKLEGIKANYDKELLKTQLEIQEYTFQYISREIHDNIGQFISLAKLHLNTLEIRETTSAQRIGDAVDLLTRALDELRDLSRSLSLEVIRNGGLTKAIEQLVIQLQKPAIAEVIYEIRGDYQFLDEQKEIFILRILQEAINNVIRHSRAGNIKIILTYENNQLTLLIRDDGIGFNTAIIQDQKNTSGLSNMMKRANMIKATFEIESALQKGTTIIIVVPY